jgi:hypothetical protein
MHINVKLTFFSKTCQFSILVINSFHVFSRTNQKAKASSFSGFCILYLTMPKSWPGGRRMASRSTLARSMPSRCAVSCISFITITSAMVLSSDFKLSSLRTQREPQRKRVSRELCFGMTSNSFFNG